MKSWLFQHFGAARLAFRRLATAPFNTLLSFLAIGVALSLPAAGQMLLVNLQRLSETSTVLPQISIFMASDADARASREIAERLKRFGGLRHVEFLPREETLARLKSSEGLHGVIEALPDNPFPDAFVATPDDTTPATLEKLASEFRSWPHVEHVQLDSAWLQRLDALFRLGRTGLILLATLLGLGLIALTFNIIRLQILVSRAEIEVSQLLGATDRFIRRPFLYFGTLLGLGGGFTAMLLVLAATLWLRAPLAELMQLYGIILVLQPLSVTDTLALLGCAAVLGWTGTVLSLRQFLR